MIVNMMCKAIISQINYLKYEFKNRALLNAIFLLLFAGLYIYFLTLRGEALNRSNMDSILVYNYLLIYLVMRIVLSGINTPFEVLNTEFISNNLLLKQPIICFNVEYLLSSRIILKVINSFLLNGLSFSLLLLAGGLVSNITNYLVLLLPMFVGTLFVATIGYVLSSTLFLLNVKREFISLIQGLFIILFLSVSGEDNYFFPLTIIRNRMSGILMSDIVYLESGIKSTLHDVWYWLLIIVLSLIVISITSFLVNVFFHKNEYKLTRKGRLI